MKQNHVNFKIEKCGTFVSAEYPWIHSPDFLCACDYCAQGCGEIKCPYCLKDADFISYTEKPTSCLFLNGDKYMPRRNHHTTIRCSNNCLLVAELTMILLSVVPVTIRLNLLLKECILTMSIGKVCFLG